MASLKLKYELADKLAQYFQHLATLDRRAAFGVIINAKFRINGDETSLKEVFSDIEDAIHTTNLILLRISKRKVMDIDIHMDIDDEDIEGEIYYSRTAPF